MSGSAVAASASTATVTQAGAIAPTDALPVAATAVAQVEQHDLGLTPAAAEGLDAIEKAQSSPLLTADAAAAAPTGCRAALARRTPQERRRMLICGGACCSLLVVLLAWLGFVVANYIELARCVHIDVRRVNTTSLCGETVTAHLSLATSSPSRFSLLLGETRLRMDVHEDGQPRNLARPAVRVVIPPFELAPGDAHVRLDVSLSVVDAGALGHFLNRTANGERGSTMRVRVLTAVGTRALLGLPLSLPFVTSRSIASALPQPSGKPADAERSAREAEAAAARAAAERQARCGSRELLTLPLRLHNTSHAFKVLWASRERLHVAALFDLHVESPAHIVLLPPLSAELCAKQPATGALTSIARVSTRRDSFVQAAALGASDAVVDVLIASDGEAQQGALWEATNTLLAHSFPALVLRGSTDAEIAAGASPLDQPAGFNNASSACPLQRALQGVSVPVREGLLESHPQGRQLVDFAACAWQQLHKGELKTSWAFAASCAQALTPSSSLLPGLVDRLSNLTGNGGSAVPATVPDEVFDWMPAWLPGAGLLRPAATAGAPGAPLGSAAPTDAMPSALGRTRAAPAHEQPQHGGGGHAKALAPIDLSHGKEPNAFIGLSFG